MVDSQGSEHPAEIVQRDLIRTDLQTMLARAGLSVSATEIEKLAAALPATLNGPTIGTLTSERDTYVATAQIFHLYLPDLPSELRERLAQLLLEQPLRPDPHALLASMPTSEKEPLPAAVTIGSGWRLTHAKDPFFVGRHADLRRLATLLKDPQREAVGLVAAVATGLGGIGKTSLASDLLGASTGSVPRPPNSFPVRLRPAVWRWACLPKPLD